jgi:hypothetical protein
MMTTPAPTAQPSIAPPTGIMLTPAMVAGRWTSPGLGCKRHLIYTLDGRWGMSDDKGGLNSRYRFEGDLMMIDTPGDLVHAPSRVTRFDSGGWETVNLKYGWKSFHIRCP